MKMSPKKLIAVFTAAAFLTYGNNSFSQTVLEKSTSTAANDRGKNPVPKDQSFPELFLAVLPKPLEVPLPEGVRGGTGKKPAKGFNKYASRKHYAAKVNLNFNKGGYAKNFAPHCRT